MKNTTSKKLERNVLAGLLGVSLVLGCGSVQTYASQVPKVSKNEAQLQKLNELKKQVAEAQRDLEKEGIDTSKINIKTKDTVKKAVNLDTKNHKDSSEVSAPDFVTRIKNILAEYDRATENPYAKLFEKKNPSAQTDGALKQETQAVEAQISQPIASATPTQSTPSINSLTSDPSKYNFDWRGTPLAQSLYGVAKIAGKGVVVNGDLSGNVFMSLKQVTCAQALDYLSSAFGFNWMSDGSGSNIIISTKDLMQQSKIFHVDYANKEFLKKEFAAMGIPEANVYANVETGTISVTGTPYQLEEAGKRLKELDHPVSQCLLLAQLIEIDHGKSLDLGLQYTLPTYSHEGSSGGSSDSGSSSGSKGFRLSDLTYSASSRASRALSKGRVIARPMVMSLNGQKGVVSFGDSVPILTKTDTGSSNSLTVTYQDIGTKLEVTPVINESSGDITLTINTEVSNITSWVISGDTRAPQTSKRSAVTSAHVKSGQSFVIGGLMSQKELDNLSGIPGLMNLPILGKLFSYHTRSKDYSEVYIMITPFIVTDNINTQKMYDELAKYDKETTDKKIVLPGKDWAAPLMVER